MPSSFIVWEDKFQFIVSLIYAFVREGLDPPLHGNVTDSHWISANS